MAPNASSTITIWDEQLQSLHKEVAEQSAAMMDIKNFADRDAVEAKLALLQFQNFLDRTIERINAMAARKNELPVRERTMLHWAQVYASKVRGYYETQVRTWLKLMWLRLIESRLATDPKPTISMLSDDQLLNLATRQQRLAQTEDQLSERLLQLSIEKQTMHQHYDTLMTTNANRQAAVCMQASLGKSPEEAAKNPVLISTGLLLRRLAHRVFAPKTEIFELQNYERQIDEQSQSVVAKCRTLALDVLRHQSANQRQKNDDAFKQALADIDTLSHKIDELTTSIGYDRANPSPKVVKNIANQATTVGE